MPGALVSARGNSISVGVLGQGMAACSQATSSASKSILSIRVLIANL